MSMILVALVATILFLLGLFISYISFKKVRNWFKNNKKKAVAIIVSGGIVSAGIVFLPPGDVVKNPVPVIKDMPYIWIEPHGMGTFGYWKLNETFYRNWLNNTVSWKVEKSVDGVHWSDYKKFVVKKDWNSIDLSEKHTIIVDADEDAYYRILTNTKSDKQLVSFEDKSSVTLYELSFKVSDDRSYTLFYNWSDYSKSPEASKTVLSKSVKTDVLSSKQYFEWAVTSSVKLKAGEQFVLDPVYGTIGDAVTDSWEWDTEEGFVYSPYALLKMGDSNYYLTCAFGDTGSDYDGFLRVLEVNADGTFVEALKDKWEYDTSDGNSANMIHISGDVYAICYADAAIGTLFTTKAYSSNGTLRETIIDTVNLDLRPARYPNIVHVTGDIYAIVYQESAGGYDHWIETFSITSDGAICADALDTEEFDTTSAANTYTPSSCMVDSDTLVIVWQESATEDCWMMTYTISDAGAISDAPVDSWEFDNALADPDIGSPFIYHISGNIFAVSYADTDNDGWTKTVSIADDGTITESWIDTLEWGNNQNNIFISMFTVTSADDMPGNVGVYGLTSYFGGTYSRVLTINISSDGTIGNTINDYLSLPIAFIIYSPCVYVGSNYYLIIGTDGATYDGWSCTFTIETYEAPAGGWTNVCPIAKGEHPTNGTTNVVLKPAVGCTITDSNSNHTMNVTFATNSSGTWRNFQTNSSVANNSKVNWTMSMAGTGNAGYSWRVYVHDGICNQSFTYSFTTAANATPSVNHDPSVTAAFPLDDAIDISVNVNRHNITVSDPDGNLMNYSYHYFIEGCNLAGDNEGAVSNGTYSLILNDGVCCPLEYDTVYTWWVNVSDGNGGWDNETFSFTTESAPDEGITYQETIRNDGDDYFTYLGGNITASDFAANITGFDESNEYIAIWTNGTYDAINGNWKLYYGDGTGTDFTFTTFMICKVNLTDAGTQVIDMLANSNMNYTKSKTIPLRNLTNNKGYNFTSKNTYAMTTLSAINTTIGLDVGEALWMWNQTNYEWDIWIPYFGFTDKNVYRWDVLQIKVENSEAYTT